MCIMISFLGHCKVEQQSGVKKIALKKAYDTDIGTGFFLVALKYFFPFM